MTKTIAAQSALPGSDAWQMAFWRRKHPDNVVYATFLNASSDVLLLFNSEWP